MKRHPIFARGRVIELGAGNGENFRLYPGVQMPTRPHVIGVARRS